MVLYHDRRGVATVPGALGAPSPLAPTVAEGIRAPFHQAFDVLAAARDYRSRDVIRLATHHCGATVWRSGGLGGPVLGRTRARQGSFLMAFQPADRVSRLPAQFFAGLMAEATARQRAGQRIINLGQGNPVDPTPPGLLKALAAAADPQHQRYGSFRGLAPLIEAASHWWHRRYGVVLDPMREVAGDIGVKVGLAELSLLAANEGDGVLVPDPGYPDYDAGIALAEARRLAYPLMAGDGYQPDFARLPDARLMFLNYPHNPTGALATSDTLVGAAAWARRTGGLLAQDLAYGDMVFDGGRARSLLAEPGAREVGMKVLILSKTFHMAGGRIGLVAGGSDVIAAFETLPDHLHCSQCGAIPATAVALEQGDVWVDASTALYPRRRDLVVDGLRGAGIVVPKPMGGSSCGCPYPVGVMGAGLPAFCWTTPTCWWRRLGPRARRRLRSGAGSRRTAGLDCRMAVGGIQGRWRALSR